MSEPTVVTLRDVKRRRRQFYVRAAIAVVCVLVVAVCVCAWRFNQRMKASLPQLDGEVAIAGLAADVTVTRDALGVPTINAATRLDAARALGFLHAQDRFFQMDLARRRAAGELSELFGEKTLAADKGVRVHRLRALAQKSLALLPEAQRALLDTYTEGVNAGLAQLREPPFEYLLLGEKPRAWLPEDSVLVIHAMAIDLQHPDGVYERTLLTIREWYDNKVLAYFAPVMAPNDSALDGTTAPLAPLPGPNSINLRASVATTAYAHMSKRLPPILAEGSNSMAFGGTRGAGMIENDMHLTLRVPGTWYRVSMKWRDTADRTITGITHPGAPVVVAGSNGKIAWGFTNSFADTSDVVYLTPDKLSPDCYYAGKDFLFTEHHAELIQVRGEKKPVSIDVETCIWGPIIDVTKHGQKMALKWVFGDPAAANYNLVELETADSVPAAIDIAKRCGIPAQNILVTDTTGDIGWTICGRLPDRFGHDGRTPATWAYGDRGWRGLLPPEKTPAIIQGITSRLSTANQRLFGGDTFAILGDGCYRSGERGARIQDLLSRLDKEATPRDLLAVALDDSAPHLARWHKLLKDTLAATQDKKLARFRDASGAEWSEGASRASLESSAYPIVRKFREHVVARILTPIFDPCMDEYPNFNYNRLNIEDPVWNIIQLKPIHLLAPEYANWDELLVAAADDARRELASAGFSNPAEARWGAFNVSRIRHPLSGGAMGLIGGVLNLDMPAQELPGDDNMPRVQYPDYGASMRFVVSPGWEKDGIFEMPCGQSGHPLSPYYRAGHDAWVRGEPTPFLPGATEHTLVLKAKGF